MSQVYTVKAVRGPKEWTGRNGPMLTYILDLEKDGVLERGIETNRKPTSPAPQNGELLAGEIGPNTHNPSFPERFTLDYDATKELTQPQTRSQPSSAPSSTYGKSDDVQRQIIRQHSQEMALRYLAICGSEHVTKYSLLELTDWFDADVLSQAASSGQEETTQPAAPPEVRDGGTPAQNSPSAEHTQRIEDLLLRAGAESYEEARWLMSEAYHPMLDDERSACDGFLASEDHGKARKALERLRERAPGFKPEKDDIPF